MKTLKPHFFDVRLMLLLVAICSSTACTAKNITADLTLDVASSSTSIVDINSADMPALESVPGIGPALASRIIAHRDRYGPFRRIEHLLLIEGVSDRRFREMRPLIKIN